MVFIFRLLLIAVIVIGLLDVGFTRKTVKITRSILGLHDTGIDSYQIFRSRVYAVGSIAVSLLLFLLTF